MSRYRYVLRTMPCITDSCLAISAVVTEAFSFSKANIFISIAVPIQIRIEDDAMYISNCSMLPFGWTVETLLSTHVSKPYNPDIARVFYRAGYIESWGRGIQKICDACRNLGVEDRTYFMPCSSILFWQNLF